MAYDIEVGDKAPDFTLKDQSEKEIALGNFKGQKVILSFHPLAWTSVCTAQMQDLERHKGDFARMNAVAVGISVDSVPCKKAWAEAIGVKETPPLGGLLAPWRCCQVIRHFPRAERFQ